MFVSPVSLHLSSGLGSYTHRCIPRHGVVIHSQTYACIHVHDMDTEIQKDVDTPI